MRTVAFVSLGCPKNLVDSEKMLGLLAEDGVLPVDEDQAQDEGVDAMVINTCGFLEASKSESMGEIERAAALKREGKVRRVVVAGCLVQRHRAKLLEWCPDIDALIGVFDRDRIVEAVRGPATDRTQRRDVAVELPVYSSIAANATVARRERGAAVTPGPRTARLAGSEGYYEDDGARLRLTPRHYAYLRVSEGCNQNCAFCTIPSIRGKMRSKPVDRIAAEARELLNDGAFELNLIGQDTTSYGQDIGYGPGLAGMLGALNGVVSEFGSGASGGWLRLMYAYPSCFTDEMIDAIAALPAMVKYIDMPLQHINDRVLDAMRRRTSRKLIETLLAKLRDRIPGIAIRTTFITGFPGETQAEHEELVDFIRAAAGPSGWGGFDAMGVFTYSPEPGTPAGRMYHSGQSGMAIPEEVAQERYEELMLAQQEVAFGRNAAMGENQTELDVLIDGAASSSHLALEDSGQGVAPDASHFVYCGRTYAQAPQIDGITYVVSAEKLTPGELAACRVVGFEEYDLIARPMADLTRRVALPVMG